jgi:hypothetical protein
VAATFWGCVRYDLDSTESPGDLTEVLTLFFSVPRNSCRDSSRDFSFQGVPVLQSINCVLNIDSAVKSSNKPMLPR